MVTASEMRRREIDVAVKTAFEAARVDCTVRRACTPICARRAGRCQKMVAASMRRQGLVARPIKRRRGHTRPDKTKKPFPDLLKRDFTANEPNRRWVGDMTEIPVAEHGKLYLASVIDLYSRRLLGAAISRSPNAELACSAIRIAVAVRGAAEEIKGVILHTDRG